MQRFLQKNQLDVKMKMELTSNESVKQALIAGLGYSIMPLIGLRNELSLQQLQIIPVKGLPIKSVWNLIWLVDKKLSPVAYAFLHYVRKEKASIIKNKFEWFEQYT
jgi:DNA-binding transcriptional LysR family regulator